jgi:nucleoside-diphosphate-sugar epimerase
LKKISFAFGKKPRLLPIPESLLTFGATMLGKRGMAQRLCGSLQVDISKAQDLLGWTPSVSMAEELQRTVDYYLQHLKK